MKTVRTKTLKDGRKALLKERRMTTDKGSDATGLVLISFDELTKLYNHAKQRRKKCKKFGMYAVHLSQDVSFLVMEI